MQELRDMQWRVDATLSTSSANKVLRPSVLMRLELKDGQIQMLDLNSDSFGQLRCRVAELLTEMEAADNLLNKQKRPVSLKQQDLQRLKISDQFNQGPVP
ncbi:hypothetical protein O6H91_04G057700 [Diphasiastrum complanatum]|uniref:Uncharacterized protein n=1 Tax=Diphasiastrum complanatum TaxID=34168 RepID=A0ACC2DX60_DIPCM|nr:hypothetical protein O6H91_04G057700 [Diphasiastrum complanatum]